MSALDRMKSVHVFIDQPTCSVRVCDLRELLDYAEKADAALLAETERECAGGATRGSGAHRHAVQEDHE